MLYWNTTGIDTLQNLEEGSLHEYHGNEEVNVSYNSLAASAKVEVEMVSMNTTEEDELSALKSSPIELPYESNMDDDMNDSKVINPYIIEVDYDSQPKGRSPIRSSSSSSSSSSEVEAIECVEDCNYDEYDTSNFEEFFFVNHSHTRKQEDMNEYDEYESAQLEIMQTTNVMRDPLNDNVDRSTSGFSYPSEWTTSRELDTNNPIFISPKPVPSFASKDFEKIYGEKGGFHLSNPSLGVKVSSDFSELSSIYSKESTGDANNTGITNVAKYRNRNVVPTTASAGDFMSVYPINSKSVLSNPLRRLSSTGSPLDNSPASPLTTLYSTSGDSTTFMSNPTSHNIRKASGRDDSQFFTYDNISTPEQKGMQYFNVARKNTTKAPQPSAMESNNNKNMHHGKPSKFSIFNFFMESQPKLSNRRFHHPQDALESIDYSTLYPERVEPKPKVPRLSPLKLLISQFDKPAVKSALSQVSLKPIKIEVENPMNHHPAKKVISEQEALDKEKFQQIRNFFESMSKRPQSPDSFA